MIRCLAVFVAIACLPVAAAAQRLPTTVVPDHYDLAFTPDLAAETFEGRARIRVRVTEPTRSIVLHAAELTITDARVETPRGSLAAENTTNAAAEQLTLTLPSEVEGAATLDLRFTGTLNERLRGFYISRTKRRKYAGTQFQATDARRAFPCFDEPGFKATFDVALTIDEGDIAISNGKVVADTPGPGAGKRTVTFETTPKMSTYLVAMAVGDFTCLETRVEGTPVRVCAVPEKAALGAFAVASVEHVLPWFNRYYGIPYPFGKLDVVALPDFGPGAMENTGAIFYRESLLLVDEPRASVSALKTIAFVMAHEVAHQWFGDLVTPRWWNDIWLNEGFANWAARKAVEGWRGWSFARDGTEETLEAMAIDSLATTRRVRTQVTGQLEIEEVIDALTYDKASAVLRMIEHYVGDDAFRTGVSAYLRKFSYTNATAEDFWGTLAETTGRPVDRVMASFFEQPGVPRIEIRQTCASGAAHVTLSQERFMLGPRTATRPRESWSVPVCFERPDESGRTCELLASASATVTLPGCAPWLHGNDDAVGYYRVAYDEATVSAMAKSGFTGLNDPELLSLEADVWALVREGSTDVATYLELAEGLARAPGARATLTAVVERLVFLSDRVVATEDRDRWESWVRRLLQPLASELGWTPGRDEPAETRQLRAAVLRALGRVGRDSDVTSRARALVLADLDGTHAAEPSLATTVYELAALSGGEELYERLLASLPSTSTPADYYRRLGALTQFREPALVDRTLEYLLSDDVRNQDAPATLRRLLANPAARDRVWSAIKDRWREVTGKTDIMQGALHIVRGLDFCDPDAARDVERYFASHPVPGASRTVPRTLEQIEVCAATRQAQKDRLSAALQGPLEGH